MGKTLLGLIKVKRYNGEKEETRRISGFKQGEWREKFVFHSIMNQKNTIQLTIISVLLILVLIGLAQIRQSGQKEHQYLMEEIISEPSSGSQAEKEYRLEGTNQGTKIHYLPLGITIVAPPGWITEIETDSSGRSLVQSKKPNNLLDENRLLRDGCYLSIDLSQAPLRWQNTSEKIISLSAEKIEGERHYESFPLGKFDILQESRTTNNGHRYLDITVPLNDYYLLDISALFSSEHKDSCLSKLYHSLSTIKLN
jgi:hypothetical protein